MPSDARIQLVQEALAVPTESFRSAVATTAEEVRSYLAAHSASSNGQAGRLDAELGSFASGRIDVERLAPLFTDSPTLDPRALETIERALRTLSELTSRRTDAFLVDVAPGQSLRDAVAKALGEIGRAFGAARMVELSRRGRDQSAEQAGALGPFPFGRWTKAQRRLAPPLVVHVDGADLHVSGLAEFLDGSQKFVLVVRGESPPAPLVRLITPETFVVQTRDRTGLDRLAVWRGPGIAALVPEGAAEFVHDPAGGTRLWDRLTVTHMPEEMPRKPVGALSAAQQAEELRQLQTLATKPVDVQPTAPGEAGAAGTPAAPAAADQVDKLAAWLLSQANLG